MLIPNARHLRTVLDVYAEHYNRPKPPRPRLDLRAPLDDPNFIPFPTTTTQARRRDALGDLLNGYQATA